jgi:hypothetical protein
VKTTGTPKATEPSFRAGLSVASDIVRQSEVLSILSFRPRRYVPEWD